MRNARFIELLNLYVDQEISVEEAAELETEILRSTKRRAVYNQYCKLQRGCVGLFESANSHAPAPQLNKLLAAAQAADQKVAEFPALDAFPTMRSSPSWWRTAAVGGAMAASVALVGIVALRQTAGFNEQPVSAVATVGSPAPANAAPVAMTKAVERTPISEPVQVATLEPRNVNAPLNAGDRSALYLRAWLRSAEVAESRNADYSSAVEPVNLEWTQNVDLAPIRQVTPEQLRFESRAPFASPAETRTFRGRGSSAGGGVELTAFQFQR